MEWFNNMEWFTKTDVLGIAIAVVGAFLYVIVEMIVRIVRDDKKKRDAVEKLEAIAKSPREQDLAEAKHRKLYKDELRAEAKKKLMEHRYARVSGWCAYPKDLQCYSLVNGLVYGEDFCKNCDAYKGKKK